MKYLAINKAVTLERRLYCSGGYSRRKRAGLLVELHKSAEPTGVCVPPTGNHWSRRKNNIWLACYNRTNADSWVAIRIRTKNACGDVMPSVVPRLWAGRYAAILVWIPLGIRDFFYSKYFRPVLKRTRSSIQRIPEDEATLVCSVTLTIECRC